MAGAASQLCKKILSCHGKRGARCASAEPSLVFGRFHDDHVADHSGMLRTAILCAKQMIRSRFCRTKPCRGVTAGDNILLNTEGRDKEAMNDVLRGHDDFYITPGWNVQGIYLACSFRMFELPHPLLCDRVDLHCVARRCALLEIDNRAPSEEDQESAHGQNGPGNFQNVRSLDLVGTMTGTFTILDCKVDDGQRHQNRHGSADEQQENVESVYVARHGRSALRPSWKVIPHRYTTRSVSGSF